MLITLGLQWNAFIVIVGFHVVNLLFFRMKRGIYPATNDDARADKIEHSLVISVKKIVLNSQTNDASGSQESSESIRLAHLKSA